MSITSERIERILSNPKLAAAVLALENGEVPTSASSELDQPIQSVTSDRTVMSLLLGNVFGYAPQIMTLRDAVVMGEDELLAICDGSANRVGHTDVYAQAVAFRAHYRHLLV